MRSEKSNKSIAFYTPNYEGRLDCFGCASLAIAGAKTERSNALSRFPIEPEAIEISGSYETCIREARQVAEQERVHACVALTGNAGNENAFCRSLYSVLRCPVVGGGAAINPASAAAGLIARGGEANLLLITDDRFTIEVDCKNIHSVLSCHEMKLGDLRTLLEIDGQEASGWLAGKKAELGLASSDWEHLTCSDLNGINAHLCLQKNRVKSGRDLERTMALRYVGQEAVFEAIQSFYEDQNAIIFGCAGLLGLLEREIKTESLGLFLFGEVCYRNAQVDFGNLMLSKIRFIKKAR